MALSSFFNLGALFIMFREVLEAVVIVTILLQLCTKLKAHRLKKFVWAGALTGTGCAIIVGIVIIIVFYTASGSVFNGDGKIVFESFLFLIASYLLTVMAFAMFKFKDYEKKWEMKLAAGASHQEQKSKMGNAGIFLLAFSTTLREGIEAVVFLFGVTAGQKIQSIILPGFVGVIMGLAVGVILYYTGRTINDIWWFMIIMCVILFFIGAGMTARTVNYWQTINWFGYFGYPMSERPWYNKTIWNWNACCSDQITSNGFFGILGAVFGYISEGNALWLFAYFGYWIEILLIIGIKLWRGVLTDAMKKRSPHVMREVAEHTPQPADKSFDDSASEAASSLRPSSDIGVTKAKAKARAVELPHRNFDHEVLDPKMGDDMDPKVAAMDPKMAVADEKVPAWDYHESR
ncbi:hypothetical protein WJX84_002270 [Apatococcus fuscideae]|uniref:High-affinity iron permease n=1 Tax=Apatococcus fuscideae TaxID=2026836 RepID=A0AAW1TAR5_9CHLO